jgi:hypothetical protein
MLPKNQPIDNLILRGPWRAQLALREMVADQDEQLAHIRLIRAFFLELLVPVAQRIEQGFLRRNGYFITLRQQSSQLPFANNLQWKLRQLTSSGICSFHAAG